MGFFSKKEDKKEVSLPSLPELPSLPSEFSGMDEDYSRNDVHELPSFPNSSMGDKFSQETIKNAISGDEEEDEEEMPEQLIPRPDFKKIPRPTYSGGKEEFSPKKISTKPSVEEPRETGPVFIRIDKFEEALHVFKETKDKIDEIEKLLGETKELKDKEEEELATWEKEIQDMKAQIEKVDKDIFSKI